MKWIAGSEESDAGVIQLKDGTLIAKVYSSHKSGVVRTWRLLCLGTDRSLSAVLVKKLEEDGR